MTAVPKKRFMVPAFLEVDYIQQPYDSWPPWTLGPYITDDSLKLLVDNDYEIVEIWPNHATVARMTTDLWPICDRIADYGLGVCINNEAIVENKPLPTDFTISLTNDEIAAMNIVDTGSYTMAQWAADINAQESIKGVSAEENFDNVILWERSVLDSDIRLTQWWDPGLTWVRNDGTLWYDAWARTPQHFIGGWTNETPSYYFNYTDPMPDIATRLAALDDIVYEVYWQNDYVQCVLFFRYMMENYPDVPLGLPNATYTDSNGYNRWWSNGSGPMFTIDHMRQVAMHDLRSIAYATKQMDFYYAAIEGQCNTSIPEVVFFTESLGLAGPILTKPTQHVLPSGTPILFDASTCIHGTPPVDTFRNTGAEAIYLLAYENSAIHSITVSGDEKSKTFTQVVSPTIPTIITPDELAEFGSNPSISYDNTNLYVAIIEYVQMLYGAPEVNLTGIISDSRNLYGSGLE